MPRAAVRPFTLSVPEAALLDLQARLVRTRLPDLAPAADPWAFGTSIPALGRLLSRWQSGFDWRAAEARLNAFPQFTAELAGIELHFMHVPGVGPAPMPLLLSHGWPGSVFEFLDIIPRLTDPARFGGDPADAFTVVAPSLPGYGPSYQPGQKRLGVEGIADAFAELMTEVLGYPRFGAQGGDWGAFIATRLGAVHPDKLTGVHLNMLAVPRDLAQATGTSEEDRRYRADLEHFLKEDVGYQWIQGTRLQTLAVALTDSPAGLAAWMLEKFRDWSDCGGDPFALFTEDKLLEGIALYWFTGCIGASFHPFWARMHGPWPIPGTVDVPTGYAQFPAEILRPPPALAARTYTDIRRWTVMPRGGHFAAMEQPEMLAEEIRVFFRPLRG
jgi:microsomal epoxide hydrolase